MEMEVQGVLLRELPVLNDMMHIFICMLEMAPGRISDEIQALFADATT